MKIIISILTLLSACVIGHAQMMPDSTANIVAYWSKGDKAIYEMKYTKEKTDSDGETTVERSTSETRIFEVLDSTATGYAVRVSYDDYFDSQLAIQFGVSANLLSELSSSITVDFLTDEFGAVQSLVNVEEQIEGFKKVIRFAIDAAFKDKQQKKAYAAEGITKQALYDSLCEQFCNEETMTRIISEDVTPLLYFHGGRYDIHEEFEYKKPIPTLTDGDVLEVTEKFWIDEELTDDEQVVFRRYCHIDSEDYLPLAKAYSYSLVAQNYTEGELAEIYAEIDKIYDELQVTFDEYSAVRIDFETGWPLEYYYQKVIKTEGGGMDSEIVETKEALLKDLI
ncbi:MAG: hypothetical protein MJY83_07130 [Bacteroidales bacterium]|nr:hypothetical protein [Bacteroidales bacterium]